MPSAKPVKRPSMANRSALVKKTSKLLKYILKVHDEVDIEDYHLLPPVSFAQFTSDSSVCQPCFPYIATTRSIMFQTKKKSCCDDYHKVLGYEFIIFKVRPDDSLEYKQTLRGDAEGFEYVEKTFTGEKWIVTKWKKDSYDKHGKYSIVDVPNVFGRYVVLNFNVFVQLYDFSESSYSGVFTIGASVKEDINSAKKNSVAINAFGNDETHDGFIIPSGAEFFWLIEESDQKDSKPVKTNLTKSFENCVLRKSEGSYYLVERNTLVEDNNIESAKENEGQKKDFRGILFDEIVQLLLFDSIQAELDKRRVGDTEFDHEMVKTLKSMRTTERVFFPKSVLSKCSEIKIGEETGLIEKVTFSSDFSEIRKVLLLLSNLVELQSLPYNGALQQDGEDIWFETVNGFTFDQKTESSELSLKHLTRFQEFPSWLALRKTPTNDYKVQKDKLFKNLRHAFMSNDKRCILYVLRLYISFMRAADAQPNFAEDLLSYALIMKQIYLDSMQSDKVDEPFILVQLLLPHIDFDDEDNDIMKLAQYSALALSPHQFDGDLSDKSVLALSLEHSSSFIYQASQVSTLVEDLFLSNIFCSEDWIFLNLPPPANFDAIIPVRVKLWDGRTCPAIIYWTEFASSLWLLSLTALVSNGGKDPLEVFKVALIVFVCANILSEFGQIRSATSIAEHFDFWNILDLIGLLLLFIWMVLHGDRVLFPYAHTALSVATIPISMGILRYFTVVNILGPYIMTLVRMVMDMSRFVFIFVIIALGYVLTYLTIYKGDDAAMKQNVQFDTFFHTVLYLYVQFMGNVDYDDSSSNQFVSAVLSIVTVLFIWTSSVLLINLLIARMSNTYESVMRAVAQLSSMQLASAVQDRLTLTRSSSLNMLPAPLNLIPIAFRPLEKLLMNYTSSNISVTLTVSDFTMRIVYLPVRAIIFVIFWSNLLSAMVKNLFTKIAVVSTLILFSPFALALSVIAELLATIFALFASPAKLIKDGNGVLWVTYSENDIVNDLAKSVIDSGVFVNPRAACENCSAKLSKEPVVPKLTSSKILKGSNEFLPRLTSSESKVSDDAADSLPLRSDSSTSVCQSNPFSCSDMQPNCLGGIEMAPLINAVCTVCPSPCLDGSQTVVTQPSVEEADIEDEWFYLKSSLNGLVLTINEPSSENGVFTLSMEVYKGEPSQLWKLNRYNELESQYKYKKLVLSLKGGNREKYADVCLSPSAAGDESQEWCVIPFQSDESFYLQPKNSSLVLAIKDLSNMCGASLWMTDRNDSPKYDGMRWIRVSEDSAIEWSTSCEYPYGIYDREGNLKPFEKEAVYSGEEKFFLRKVSASIFNKLFLQMEVLIAEKDPLEITVNKQSSEIKELKASINELKTTIGELKSGLKSEIKSSFDKIIALLEQK